VDTEKAENLDRPYQLAELREYPWNKRLMIRLIARTAVCLIGLIARTIRFETEGWEHFENTREKGQQPIFALWHDRIFLGTYVLRGRRIVAMTSQSFDGEYIARIIQLQGNGAVRGSSTRGGVKGLVEMIRLAKQGLPMCFIVDGPKGPPHVVKEGAVLLAKKAGIPILPLSVEVKAFSEAKSWDKMQIPRPFTKAKAFVAEPIYVSADAGAAELGAKQQELQNVLDKLVDLGRQWRDSQ
jgi:lysophospholipid acyltransferase (LPLAT)-like uncharacterized protein